MADISGVTENRIIREAAAAVARKRLGIGGVGLCLVLGVGIALSPFGLAVSGLVALVGVVVITGLVLSVAPDPVLLAGARGELLALEELKRLPGTYHVFNQVDVPNEHSRTGVNEADLIVTGPNAVFVIEVKHNSGRVSGGAGQREWTVHKSGRRGGRYVKTLRNPVLQVQQLVRLLASQLGGFDDRRGARARRGRPWVQGIVVFSNDAVELAIDRGMDVPCLRLHHLCEYILRFPSRASGMSGADARGALLAIKAKAA
jgi:nuclease-like protein